MGVVWQERENEKRKSAYTKTSVKKERAKKNEGEKIKNCSGNRQRYCWSSRKGVTSPPLQECRQRRPKVGVIQQWPSPICHCRIGWLRGKKNTGLEEQRNPWRALLLEERDRAAPLL